MYTLLIAIHVISSLFLIAVILLQAGRGGGLADSFGGSQMQNLFGTKSTNVLTKLTTICAALFIITCLSLAILSGQRSRSLVDNIKTPEAALPADVAASGAREEATEASQAPAAQETTDTTPVDAQGGADEAR
ncbi:MAG: preprotein translocase subunit SecG [Candidatus Omnitrophica bacterium]|nr:preprotein translocase subunit SecG [Candidatus Omnitrophota bacterium]